jgi:acetylornithine/succinyldiaminopimelate/putrescine aminotransferase
MEKGLLVLSAGPDVVRLLPPLNVSADEVDEAMGIMEGVLCEVESEIEVER